ncbi:hypothetical protein GCM10020258_43260 [Sphingomonas yabuuchiae]
MIPIDGLPVLTAAEMHAAEQAAMVGEVTEATLMDRAGSAIAQAVARLAAGREILVLCGPGNNGGDGYIAAAALKRQGLAVRVAASDAPRSTGACRAAAIWGGAVEALDRAEPAPVFVDAIFGTGLSRSPSDEIQNALARLAEAAWLRIAVDLPTGVAMDNGKALGKVPRFDVTLALGAVKPSHLLQPAASLMGQVRLLDIGVATRSHARTLTRWHLPEPDANSHKYSRGMVAVIAGSMSGASELTALAALRAGAGYVLHLASAGVSGSAAPHAVVRRDYTADALDEDRIGAVVIGPGLGRDADASARLEAALSGGRPLIIDGDALRLVELGTLAKHKAPKILTPTAASSPICSAKSPTTSLAPRAAPPGKVERSSCTRVPIPSSPPPMARQSSARRPAPGCPPQGPATCWPERSVQCWRRGSNRLQRRRRGMASCPGRTTLGQGFHRGRLGRRAFRRQRLIA